MQTGNKSLKRGKLFDKLGAVLFLHCVLSIFWPAVAWCTSSETVANEPIYLHFMATVMFSDYSIELVYLVVCTVQ